MTTRRAFLGLALAATVARPAAAARALDVTRLPLGQPIDGALAQLAEWNVQGGQRFGAWRIFETPVFSAVFARQRLALEERDGLLARAAVIVDPGFPDQIERTFNDVFDEMLTLYGRPRRDRNRGRFGPNLATAIETGVFRRRIDWRADGGTLRLGIPRRLDDRLRVEVHYAPRLPLGGFDDWGVPTI